MVDSESRIDTAMVDGTMVVRLRGSWLLSKDVVVFDERRLFGDIRPETLRFENDGLERWDSSLVAVVLRIVIWAREKDVPVDASGVPDNLKKMIDLAMSVTTDGGEAKGQSESGMTRFGTHVILRAERSTEALSFIGESVISLGRLLIGRSRMRWGELWVAIQDAGPSALPIVTLISFLVGLILAFLGATILTQFGAEIYTAHLVGFGMLRELGAIMTAIVVVGRTGAAYAASIGTMRVGEEIDALQVLGVPISDYIVLPRLLALSLMMPLLTLYADLIGITGGMLISMTLQDVTPRLFVNTLITAVHLDDFLIGIFKGAVFGVLIAVTGCLRGLQCGSNAEAVGKATTSAVVTGTTLVIIANAIIDWLETLA